MEHQLGITGSLSQPKLQIYLQMRHVYCIVGEGFIQNADVLVRFALPTPRLQGSPVALVGSPAEQPLCIVISPCLGVLLSNRSGQIWGRRAK